MNVLAVNCGSSTLKFRVIALDEGTPFGEEKILAGGLVDRIGGQGELQFVAAGGETLREGVPAADHGVAARLALQWVESCGLLKDLGAVGHRVVHGGDRFSGSSLIDDGVLGSLEALSILAPLHNAPSLQAIRAVQALLDSDIPAVAVFDTSFHWNIPARAGCYAIPMDLAERHGIRRYGFHGIAHQYLAERYSLLASISRERRKLITLQLGNGCSAAAVQGASSVDTSMGFTPLEGLMMGTRSGDIDPSIMGFLEKAEGLEAGEVEDLLNRKSGLLGVSGRSRDMRELLRAEREGDVRAALAVEMFSYRVRKQIGAYLAALGGAEAVIFGGGIGENSPEIRSRICAGMEWCGLRLDESRNAAATGNEARISTDDARVHVYVIPVEEAVIIARETCAVCASRKG